MNDFNGEWDTEPEEESWKDPITGYTCRIIRGPVKSLCGYVYVPESHPWFKLGYTETLDEDSSSPELHLEVHGGCTFSGSHKGDQTDVWCFGFDCAHSGDVIPGMLKYGFAPFNNNDQYRNWKYVKKVCGLMAEQLAALEPKLLTEEVAA